MFRLAATLRIAFGLACLTASLVLAARSLGLLPDQRAETRRKQFARDRSALTQVVTRAQIRFMLWLKVDA